MYRVRNIVNRRESDVICHSVQRSQAPTSKIWKLKCHKVKWNQGWKNDQYGAIGKDGHYYKIITSEKKCALS
jgi:hypothetical protein